VLIECHTISPSSYASRYEGEARHARLFFIAQRSSNLQQDALKALLRSLKKSGNTQLYEEVTKKWIGGALGAEWEFDKSWFDTMEKQMNQRLERAESEVAQAKSRAVRESIRMGHMEVGHICLERGNLQDALKAYLRSREFTSTPQHNTDMCLSVAIVSIALSQYRQAATYMSKIETMDDESIRAKVRAIAGLNALHEGQYKTAARSFLEVDASQLSFSSVLSVEDVAIYGCMCALATFNRPDLRQLVLESKAFKPLLDLVPDFKTLVHHFVDSKYGECLQCLNALKPQLMLDLHMHKFAEDVCTTISDKILIQYFTPYNSVDLRRMAQAFGNDVNTLEKSLAQLISKGRLPARIDSQAKTMHRRQTDDRHETMAKVKRLAKLHTSEIRRGILRLSLLQNGFSISSKEGKSAFRSGGAGAGVGVDGAAGAGSFVRGGEGMEVDPEHAGDFIDGDDSELSD